MDAGHLSDEVATAGATLAGLLLVFVGYLAVAYEAFESVQKPTVRPRFQRRAWFAVVGIATALISVGAAVAHNLWGFECVLILSVAFLAVAIVFSFAVAWFTASDIKYRVGHKVMSLTREAEQRLERVKLVAFFNKNQAEWLDAAQKAYTFVAGNFPAGSKIRRDDVAKILMPVIEVNEALTDKLAEGKLKQKFWRSDFVDLIIDRTWVQITEGDNGQAEAP